MRALRVAYVINSLEGGGAALPVPDVIAAMQAAGARVRLFALSRRDGRAIPAIEAAGIDYRVSDAGKADHLRAALWLRRELRAFGPDAIWTSLTQATLIGQTMGLLLRVPVASWQHNAFLKPANRRLLAFTHRLTGLWVADSQSVAALTRERLGVSGDEILVWPLFRADPDAPQASPCPEEAIFRLGSLGRLHPNKGYDILVRALGKIASDAPELSRRFEVVIGGDGAERDSLVALAEAHGVRNLVLAGYQEAPRRFLASLHGYLQPSRAEGLCIAAHEAMQAGLPLIVSQVGEMAHSVEAAGAGATVPPGDVEALATAIRMLVEDRVRAHRMGLNARSYVLEIFGAERFAAAGREAMARLYRRTVRAGR